MRIVANQHPGFWNLECYYKPHKIWYFKASSKSKDELKAHAAHLASPPEYL